MKRAVFGWVIVASLLLLHGHGAWGAKDFPKPSGPVNDFAGIIPQTDKQKMETLSMEVLQKTGTSVVVVTVSTVGDSDAAIYISELYQDWGIGKKGEDKGVLILLALKERRIRIETGYGVEGILPDGLVGEILDQYTVPFLKKGQYGPGLFNAVAAVSAVIAKDANIELSGEVKTYRTSRSRTRRISLFPLIFIILILFSLFRRGRGILPLLILGSMGGRGGFGGGFGGFGGGFGGFGGGMSGGGGAGRGF